MALGVVDCWRGSQCCVNLGYLHEKMGGRGCIRKAAVLCSQITW